MLIGPISVKGLQIENAIIKIIGFDGDGSNLIVRYGIFAGQEDLNRSSAIEVRECSLNTDEVNTEEDASLASIFESKIKDINPGFETLEQ